MIENEEEEQITTSRASQSVQKTPQATIALQIDRGRNNNTASLHPVEEHVEGQIIGSRSLQGSSKKPSHAPGASQRIQGYSKKVSRPSPVEEEEEEDALVASSKQVSSIIKSDYNCEELTSVIE